MRKIFHDDGLQGHFTETGYAQVPMLSDEEVAYIHSCLAQLRPADKFAPTGRDGFEHSYHCSFLDKSIEYKREAFALMEEVFADHIDRHLNGFRILSSNFYVKPPGTGTFVIHQNWPTIANLNDTTVTIWTPLQDVIETNGALQFVVGSHKLLPHVEGPRCPGFFDKFRPELIEKYLKPIDLSAGQSLIFDDGLIHWSANNDSDKARIAIQIACVPNDTQPVFFFFDQKHPDRFEMVEADREFYLASDVTDLCVRQPQWKHVGFCENRNRFIDEAEFAQLLKDGPAIREEAYKEENPLKPVVVSADEMEAEQAVVAAVPESVAEAPTKKADTAPAGFWAHVRTRIFGSELHK